MASLASAQAKYKEKMQQATPKYIRKLSAVVGFDISGSTAAQRFGEATADPDLDDRWARNFVNSFRR